MFDLDLFFYFEILAYLLGLSATLALASAIYLKWQRKPPQSPSGARETAVGRIKPRGFICEIENSEKLWDFPQLKSVAAN